MKYGMRGIKHHLLYKKGGVPKSRTGCEEALFWGKVRADQKNKPNREAMKKRPRYETEAWSNNSENGLLNPSCPLSTPHLTFPFRLFGTFYPLHSLSAFHI